MIIVRAPMRISFVGGGTDLEAFYRHSPGRVISAAIDKYAYVTVNRPPLLRQVSARYAIAELADHPKGLKNDRIREALLHFGIESNVDVVTFSDAPVKTGLGSSSSFSVALMKALLFSQGKKADNGEIAELASHLEINLVKEPIGKQDQYAAAFGGLNIFQFNPDNTVHVSPVRLDFRQRSNFENHLLLFFTGIARAASSVLTEQQANTEKKLEVLKKMADSVYEFRDKLVAQDFEGLGKMLHEGWQLKKTLASNISNSVIDELYETGLKAGAWGGKILGAGGGGCVLFIAPLEKKVAIREAMKSAAAAHQLVEFNEIPVHFVQSGVEVLMNNTSKTNFL